MPRGHLRRRRPGSLPAGSAFSPDAQATGEHAPPPATTDLDRAADRALGEYEPIPGAPGMSRPPAWWRTEHGDDPDAVPALERAFARRDHAAGRARPRRLPPPARTPLDAAADELVAAHPDLGVRTALVPDEFVERHGRGDEVTEALVGAFARAANARGSSRRRLVPDLGDDRRPSPDEDADVLGPQDDQHL